MASAAIQEIQSTTQQQPTITRTIEMAGQTFQIGVPLMVNVTNGGLMEWDGTTVANGIAGISKSPGANLATTGVAQTMATRQTVPNQPLAVVIPVGAPLNDGRTDIAIAVQSTVFQGQVGPTQTTLPTDLTVQYGMTKDTDNHWYVDKTKTGTAAAVVKIVKLDFWDTLRGVHFVFLPSAIQKLA
jgi:hypothetical protein